VKRLSGLAVDDEGPSLDELAYLLERSPLVGRVEVAENATDGLRLLQDDRFDAAFLDIRMPGLDGMELARVLSRFARPPLVVFVTAYDTHALEAFEVGAAGYLLKPIDAERLERVLHRVAARAGSAARGPEIVAVESGTRTLLVSREDIVWVESAGDYVRLHLRDGGSHLLHAAMASLEQDWADEGFVRVHRSFLVSLRDVSELRTEEGHASVLVAGSVLPVSRRHMHDLRERLVRHARRNGR
jgi:DNA-binding LytR/AlgR family response regulator